MKRFLTFLFINTFVSIVLAENCLAPNINEVNLNHKTSDNQAIYFAGRYSINLTPSHRVIFSKDMLAYIYNESKHFVVHLDTEVTQKNRQELLAAFGLNNDIKTDARKDLDICNGEITKYNIEGMTETIIGIDSTVLDRPNTMIYLFHEVEPIVENIQFKDFSQEEIEQILSTIEHITKNNCFYLPIFWYFKGYTISFIKKI